jgi:hypothetical protein
LIKPECSESKSDANPLPLQQHNNTEFSKSSIKNQSRKIIEDSEDSEYATAEPDEDLYSLVGDGDQDDMYDNTYSHSKLSLYNLDVESLSEIVSPPCIVPVNLSCDCDRCKDSPTCLRVLSAISYSQSSVKSYRSSSFLPSQHPSPEVNKTRTRMKEKRLFGMSSQENIMKMKRL